MELSVEQLEAVHVAVHLNDITEYSFGFIVYLLFHKVMECNGTLNLG